MMSGIIGFFDGILSKLGFSSGSGESSGMFSQIQDQNVGIDFDVRFETGLQDNVPLDTQQPHPFSGYGSESLTEALAASGPEQFVGKYFIFPETVDAIAVNDFGSFSPEVSSANDFAIETSPHSAMIEDIGAPQDISFLDKDFTAETFYEHDDVLANEQDDPLLWSSIDQDLFDKPLGEHKSVFGDEKFAFFNDDDANADAINFTNLGNVSEDASLIGANDSKGYINLQHNEILEMGNNLILGGDGIEAIHFNEPGWVKLDASDPLPEGTQPQEGFVTYIHPESGAIVQIDGGISTNYYDPHHV